MTRSFALVLLSAVGVFGATIGSGRRLGGAQPTSSVYRLRGGAIEHTYAMLKPDVAGDDTTVSAIKALIEQEGLKIEREERCRLSRGECEAFYAEHDGRAFFKDLVKFMSSGPVVKMELSGEDAIKRWRALIGPTNSATAREEAPTSVRARFGRDNQRNAAHGSDSPESAKREIGMMFKATA
jgi:nucleoside diphosphate kinase